MESSWNNIFLRSGVGDGLPVSVAIMICSSNTYCCVALFTLTSIIMLTSFGISGKKRGEENDSRIDTCDSLLLFKQHLGYSVRVSCLLERLVKRQQTSILPTWLVTSRVEKHPFSETSSKHQYTQLPGQPIYINRDFRNNIS